MQKLQAVVNAFLSEYLEPNYPVLIALSGGPDSLALFHLLLESSFPLKLGVAHVDHGWREESRSEAQALQELAAQYHLKFHLKELNPKDLNGNLEEACRQKRLEFYRHLIKQEGYQAVVLGHHRGDLEETLLKKVFEGVPLYHLQGMTPVTTMGELKLWRPLLAIDKNEILQWLDQKQLSYFYDQTNENPKFFRAAARLKLIPLLEQTFGKKIGSSLLRLQRESSLLQDYLQQKTQILKDQVYIGFFGAYFIPPRSPFLHDLEWLFLFEHFSKLQQSFLSHFQKENLLALLKRGVANKKIEMGKAVYYVDRGSLFCLAHEHWPYDPIVLSKPHFQTNFLQVFVREGVVRQEENSDWRSSWNGELSVTLPSLPYQLEIFGKQENAQIVKQQWSKQKIPACLWKVFPVLTLNGRIVHEFLTGQTHMPKPDVQKPLIQIQIRLQS